MGKKSPYKNSIQLKPCKGWAKVYKDDEIVMWPKTCDHDTCFALQWLKAHGVICTML